MEALILTCSTGGGHNAAGYAVAEELSRRGHGVTVMDPYTLVGERLERTVSGVYVGIAQRIPDLFGKIYALGDKVRRLPGHSPVYYANFPMAERLAEYLSEHPADVILMPHVFPAEIITAMKRRGMCVPLTFFLATDYVCIPFTEEADCDYYVIPSPDLAGDFICRGIPEGKLLPYGIPVKSEFAEPITKREAAERLGLSPDHKYLLLSGGSIGAGNIPGDVKQLDSWLKVHPDYRLIVICGNNESLFRRLRQDFRRNPRIILKKQVDRMYDWLHLCEVYLSKPGGLSSTEAAVAEVPLIHISPIPGCENYNIRYFGERGMCNPVGNRRERLIDALETVLDGEFSARMRAMQQKWVPKDSAARICDFCEQRITQN